MRAPVLAALLSCVVFVAACVAPPVVRAPVTVVVVVGDGEARPTAAKQSQEAAAIATTWGADERELVRDELAAVARDAGAE